MKILSINVLRGPNIWSISRKKLIQMRLDLEEMEEYPSDKVDGFSERLESMFPRMVEHRCSVGEKGGFFLRVKEGTWMGHIAEHVALEIQTLAGMFSGYGRTRSTKTKGVYNVVFNYVEEEVGLYAAKAALEKNAKENAFFAEVWQSMKDFADIAVPFWSGAQMSNAKLGMAHAATLK